jgi:glycosyltransferase involved in cell wall biosynthesis
MKICFLSTSFDDKYGGQHLYALTKGLAEKGIDITAIVPSSPNSKKSFEIKDSIKIHKFRYFTPKGYQKLTSGESILTQFKTSFIAKLQFPFFLLFFILKTLKVAKNSDLIHANWTLSCIPGLIAKKIYKKKLLLSEQGAGIRSMPPFVNKWILKNVDAIISSADDQDDIIRHFGWKKKIYDTRNISDTQKFEKKVDKTEFVSKYDLKKYPIITFMARLIPFKDPITFVQAIPFVLKQNPKVKFLIVGDGPLKEKLISFVEYHNLKNSVFILGKRDDVNVILQSSTIFVALSPISNIFSGGIREAMISKVPCIITKSVTKFGKTYEPKYYRHKEYAYLIPKENPLELANAILTLIKDDSLRRKLSKNGLKFLKEFGFEKEIVIKQTIEIYKKLINEPNQ